MVVRLIVHAGFHKTGTTTIQTTLAAHRDLLETHMHLVLRSDMTGLCEAARAYSARRSDLDLGLVQYEAARLAEHWTRDTVLLSSEDLSGHMPGRRGLTGYGAAPHLATAMTHAWRAACPRAAITWAYTTRSHDAWLASCHVQHLRAARMTMSADAYAATYAASADLGGVVADVRAHVRDCAIHAFALEDHRENLADPFLRLCDLPQAVRRAVVPRPAANTSPDPEKVAEMLALNRSDLGHADWRAAQNALHRRGR